MYLVKKDALKDKAVVLDDMILTKDMPTTAGSKMLDGYMSLFDATVVEKLVEAGYEIAGKANVGEFAIDVMGETSNYGAAKDEKGNLSLASAEIVKSGDVKAAVQLDVNGAPRRAAAINGLVYIKPTYGTVSRYGIVPVACSGECVGVMAKSAEDCADVLDAIANTETGNFGWYMQDVPVDAIIIDSIEVVSK